MIHRLIAVELVNCELDSDYEYDKLVSPSRLGV